MELEATALIHRPIADVHQRVQVGVRPAGHPHERGCGRRTHGRVGPRQVCSHRFDGGPFAGADPLEAPEDPGADGRLLGALELTQKVGHHLCVVLVEVGVGLLRPDVREGIGDDLVEFLHVFLQV